ncbi:MAG: hypothetical protein J4G14_04005 [Dehalococcoidia bacterium]|nr:hypothetical protein [Dehalococcoidia bacterium]
MTLATIIHDRTNDGTSIVEFLFAVMRDELDDFKPCHRLDAAKLLVKYDRDEARNYILDYPPEPSQPGLDSRSPDDTYFEQKLARAIQESTDDGRTVCRFLINVMDGALSAFKPHHRISAARELLSRGFGKHATQKPPLPAGEGWGESLPRTRYGGENQEQQPPVGAGLKPAPTRSDTGTDNTPTQFTPEDDDWSAFIELITPILDEDDRIKAELAKQDPDPDNPPYKRDLSAYDQAWENSEKWFYEWKNSLDPEEYEAIVARELGEFNAMIDTKIERRKQIAEERERREKEEAEQQAQQAKARAKAKEKADAESAAAKEEEDLGPPPTKEEHERWSPTPSIPTSFRLVNCGHPKCKLHDGPVYYPEDDRSSPYYWNGQQPLNFRTYPF